MLDAGLAFSLAKCDFCSGGSSVFTGLWGLKPDITGIAGGGSRLQYHPLPCRQFTGGQAGASAQRCHCGVHRHPWGWSVPLAV